MDGLDLPHADAALPALGFPLGTAVLLVVVFFLCGLFSCWYHWARHPSIRPLQWPAGTNPAAEAMESPPKSFLSLMESKQKQSQSQSLPVLMPGDEIPKFIAWPCPCEPPSPHKLKVEIQLTTATP